MTLALSLVLVWPERAGGHLSTDALPETLLSGARLAGRASTMPPFPGVYLTVTAPYTSYLPIIAHNALAEPLNTLIELINTERQRHGVSPLRVNCVLTKVAQAHSQNMAERNFFDHVDPATGMDACQRIASAGYAVYACAEILAAGYRTAQMVFQAWMNSPQHRANLLSSDFTEIGLGYAEGGRYGYYWTVNLARSR